MFSKCVPDPYVLTGDDVIFLLNIYKRIVWALQYRSLTSGEPEPTLEWMAEVEGRSPAPLLWEQAIDMTLFDLFKYGTFEFESTATEIILLAIFCILRLPIGTVSRTTVLNEPELALRELLSGDNHSRNASNIHFMGIDLALKLAGDLNIVTLPPNVLDPGRVRTMVWHASLALGPAMTLPIVQWDAFMGSLHRLGGARFNHLFTTMYRKTRLAEEQIVAWVQHPRSDDVDLTAVFLAEDQKPKEKKSDDSISPSRLEPPPLPIILADYDYDRMMAARAASATRACLRRRAAVSRILDNALRLSTPTSASSSMTTSTNSRATTAVASPSSAKLARSNSTKSLDPTSIETGLAKWDIDATKGTLSEQVRKACELVGEAAERVSARLGSAEINPKLAKEILERFSVTVSSSRGVEVEEMHPMARRVTDRSMEID